VLTLQDDKPMLEFLGVARSHHVKKLHDFLKKATELVGGTLVYSPFYKCLGQQITVHPIGYVHNPQAISFHLGSIVLLIIKPTFQRSVHGPR
jgi:hypothetical protein